MIHLTEYKLDGREEDFIVEKVRDLVGKSWTNWIKQEVREKSSYDGKGAPRSWKAILGAYIYVYSDDPELTYRGLAKELGDPKLYTAIQKWAKWVEEEYDMVQDTPGEYKEGELADLVMFPDGIDGWLCPVCGFVNREKHVAEYEVDQCSKCGSRFEYEPKVRIVEKRQKVPSDTDQDTKSINQNSPVGVREKQGDARDV